MFKFLLFFFVITEITSAISPKKLVVATHYSPPWSNGDCTGAEIDVIKEAFAYSNIEIECKYFSYARLVRTFISKKVLFATPITKFDGGDKNVFYSKKFHRYVDVAIGLKNVKVTYKDLSNSRVVAYQGASNYLGDSYKKAAASAKYLETSDRLSQIEMLLKKRVDYVVGEKNIIHHLAKSLNEKKVYTNRVLKVWDIRSASHDQELMKKFNKGLQYLIDKGRVEKIFSKYKIKH